MRAEAFHVDPVEAAEIARVVKPDADLANVAQRAAGEGEGAFQMLEDLPGLRLDAADDDLACLVGGHLSGNEDEIAGPDGRGERAGLTVRSQRGVAKKFDRHGVLL